MIYFCTSQVLTFFVVVKTQVTASIDCLSLLLLENINNKHIQSGVCRLTHKRAMVFWQHEPSFEFGVCPVLRRRPLLLQPHSAAAACSLGASLWEERRDFPTSAPTMRSYIPAYVFGWHSPSSAFPNPPRLGSRLSENRANATISTF